MAQKISINYVRGETLKATVKRKMGRAKKYSRWVPPKFTKFSKMKLQTRNARQRALERGVSLTMGRPRVPDYNKISEQLTKVAVFEKDHERLSQYAKRSGMAMHYFINRLVNDPHIKPIIQDMVQREMENRKVL